MLEKHNHVRHISTTQIRQHALGSFWRKILSSGVKENISSAFSVHQADTGNRQTQPSLSENCDACDASRPALGLKDKFARLFGSSLKGTGGSW